MPACSIRIAIEELMRTFLISTLAVALTASIGGAAAADSLGTAGPLRLVGGAPCPAGLLAQMQGKCDPAPLDAKLDPHARSAAEVQRAIKLIALIRMDQARAALDAAIAAAPNNVAAYTLRARLAIPAALASATADADAGLLLAPHDSDLLATRTYLRASDDAVGAMHDADAAIAANPNNADAYWIRARLLRSDGQLAAAEADLTKALTIEPNDTQARVARAQMRLALNRPTDAAEDASAMLQQNPADLFARQVRAVARGKLGDLKGAVDDLTAILGKPGQPTNVTPSNPSFGDLYLQRAILFAKLDRPDDAMRDLDTVAAIGGQRAILRMQVYLRAHGYADLPIDGKRSTALDDAMKACFVQSVCWPGLTQRI
jgi:tetratricopeptide (TPR) repeat protein